MSNQEVRACQQVAEAQAVSQAQSVQNQASQQSLFPQDTVTISAAAEAKQTASTIGADPDHDGK